MVPFNAANLPAAREALEKARGLSASTTRREQAHVEALAHWVAGDIDATLRDLGADPRRASARRAGLPPAPFQRLLARPARPDGRAGRRGAARLEPRVAGVASLLGCHCFAHEELGDYAIAEKSGREAIALAPDDLWAAHAVAHVLEMQGRHEEGIAWLETLEPNWEGGNNLMHHLWWHRGLYHYERGEFDKVLELYDRRFRNLASPLTQAQPDFNIDVQNAASMLFRLAAAGRRRRRPLGRAGRQGRGAHRRRAVAVHAAALDDGALRRRDAGRRPDA